MLSVAFLTTLALGGLSALTIASPIAQQITPNLNVPDGYQVGFATVSPSLTFTSLLSSAQPKPRFLNRAHHQQQDWEPTGQQSACTIGGNVCRAPTPLFPSTAGPDQLPAGVYAAAMVGLGPDDCTVCGTCYSIISSGTPYCDPNGPACA